jgi:hypothetical protein
MTFCDQNLEEHESYRLYLPVSQSSQVGDLLNFVNGDPLLPQN